MTHRTLTLAALLALPTLATAQTVPSGFYGGGSLGSGMAKAEAKVTLGGQWSSESAGLRTDVIRMLSKDLDASGFQGALHVGYRHPLPNGVVLAGELSLGFLSAKETLATGQVPTASFPSLSYALDATAEVTAPLSLSAKVGYAIDQHLPYLTLGFAQAKVEVSSQVVSNGSYRKLASGSERRGGLQWGLGYEYTVNTMWSVFGEFTSANLGEFDVTSVYLPGSSFVTPPYTETFTHKVTLNTLRVGASYRF